MTITTYADVDELLPLIGIAATETYDEDRLQRLLNTAARLFDKETRRYIVEGQEAYSETASTTRYVDDWVCGNYVEVPDLLSVSAIVRGSTTLTTDQYKLLPRNRGNGPITEIQFQQYQSITRDTEDHYYYNTNGFITDGIAITGVWGYCTIDNRPDAIKEAVLQWAAIMYKTGAVSVESLLQMATVNGPTQFMAAGVRDIIKVFKRGGELRVA